MVSGVKGVGPPQRPLAICKEMHLERHTKSGWEAIEHPEGTRYLALYFDLDFLFAWYFCTLAKV